ncbi:hypothetical protein BJ878DRAFT_61293 [Calycina marina]|uniref:Uncharacterized protein n=1 Tax=Calycina marina TaxID=1763456 RepID=A0A9P7ZAJ3_9HELO|nr:hypothetical protein BJ878DRAFT_61293 [Calycina marina]
MDVCDKLLTYWTMSDITFTYTVKGLPRHIVLMLPHLLYTDILVIPGQLYLQNHSIHGLRMTSTSTPYLSSISLYFSIRWLGTTADAASKFISKRSSFGAKERRRSDFPSRLSGVDSAIVFPPGLYTANPSIVEVHAARCLKLQCRYHGSCAPRRRDESHASPWTSSPDRQMRKRLYRERSSPKFHLEMTLTALASQSHGISASLLHRPISPALIRCYHLFEIEEQSTD